MFKRRNLIRLLLLLGIVILTIVNNYVQDGLIKQICNLIGVVTAAFIAVKTLWPRSGFVTKLDYELRKVELFDVMLGEETEESVLDGEPFEKFKSKVLVYTSDQLEKLNGIIQSPEIFNFDFPIIEKFEKGASAENHSQDWANYLNKQFLFITGDSGSGKTFELLKRVGHISGELEPGKTNHELLRDKKLPLYIELKSLDRKLDHKWIVNYVSKAAQTLNHPLNEKQLLALINKQQVIYFFDGLDEVQQRYQDDCVKQLIALAQDTGVHVTCRKKVFNRLCKRGIIKREEMPAEYYLNPLSIDWVKSIINDLQDREETVKSEMIRFIDSRPNLQDHLSRSIFLNMFIQVYVDLTEEEKRQLESDDENVSMDILWGRYEAVVARAKLPPDSDIPAIRTITVWLAKIMGNDSFFIESIQPHWLRKIKNGLVTEDKLIQGLYHLVTRTLAAVIIGIALSCVIATPATLLSTSVCGGVTISLMAGIYNFMPAVSWIRQWLSALIFSILMIVVLIVVCGAYQGLILPRSPVEMTTSYFSFTEAWPGILLGITLSIIFSYRIVMEKVKHQYILPVELFHFDWNHAVRYGLSWGCASGFITGGIAIYVRHHYAHTRFISQWLVPHLQGIVQKFGGQKITDQQIDTAVFIYAFVVTFFVASLIIILLAGRFNDTPQTDIKLKQKLNYAIRESGRHAFKHAWQVGLVAFCLYGAGVQTMGLGNWFLCIKISLGIAMLAFLWFGGMEVINHRILRLNLSLKGIAPINYNPWEQAQKRMGLIIPSGYRMKFYHSSLAGFYERYPLSNNQRLRLKKKNIIDYISYTLLLMIGIGLLLLPFYQRYHAAYFWKNKYEGSYHIPNMIRETDSTFRFTANEKLKVSVGGRVVVGSFVGYAWPEGTTCGFMGMPIDSAYNVEGLGRFRHAAFLYRIKRGTAEWSPYKYLYNLHLLKVSKDDQIMFLVNDKEYENNSGHYRAEMTLCDTCK
jgi:hypothetical protein